MMRNLTVCLLASVMSAALVPAIALAAEAAKAPAASTYKAPTNVFGQPDLQGVWTNASLTTLERPASYGERLVMTPAEVAKIEGANNEQIAKDNKPTDPSLKVTDLPQDCGRGFVGVSCGYNGGWVDPGDTVMRVGGQPRTGFLLTPNGRVPARKAGVQAPANGGRVSRANMGPNDNPEQRSLGERCILSFGRSSGPPMLPLLYNNNYQFVQTKDEVAIDVEMVHDVRHVRLNTTRHLPSNIRPWLGDSIGHYEGNTLVVETTNMPQAQQFQGSWENLKITERFTRVSPTRILYRFTIEDPTMWDAAWSGEYEFGPSKGIVYEYACHEGNYALEGILAGARAEEVTASAKSALAAPAARQ
jgi:hypothetical protein